jgi:hypothetical protein
MKNVKSTLLLSDLTKLTQELINQTSKSFSKLNSTQLNWKPNIETWSINQIFSHLNLYAEFYHEQLTKRIESTRFTEPSAVFTSSPLGRSAWKSMKLGNANNVKRKFRAPKDYNPQFNAKELKENEALIFTSMQEQMVTILKRAESVSLRKVKVPISISRIIKLRLGDCLLFVIYHNERHLHQALNLIKHPGFPKK